MRHSIKGSRLCPGRILERLARLLAVTVSVGQDYWGRKDGEWTLALLIYRSGSRERRGRNTNAGLGIRAVYHNLQNKWMKRILELPIIKFVFSRIEQNVWNKSFCLCIPSQLRGFTGVHSQRLTHLRINIYWSQKWTLWNSGAPTLLPKLYGEKRQKVVCACVWERGEENNVCDK